MSWHRFALGRDVGLEVCEEIVGGGEWDDFVSSDGDAARSVLHGWMVWPPDVAEASEVSALRLSHHIWRNGVVRLWPCVCGELLKPCADGGRLGLIKSPALGWSAHCAKMAVAGGIVSHLQESSWGCRDGARWPHTFYGIGGSKCQGGFCGAGFRKGLSRRTRRGDRGSVYGHLREGWCRRKHLRNTGAFF
jgi:hypothetical protein